MNITGIIVEYNPFHNGHKYHIEKTKELTKPDLLIAITTGNYSQRGDLSIIDKFEKAKAALDNGVDLVIELPAIYALQNAYVFASNSIRLLNYMHINNLVFGSETNNLEELSNFASYNIDVTHLKEIMNDGTSFPKAYGLLAGSLYPNDILAVAYLKALKETNIKPVLIQRTTNYHDLTINNISSASAIRKAIEDSKEYKQATPIEINNPVFTKDIYPIVRNILMTRSNKELEKIFLVSEGIENLLISNAFKYTDYYDFINASISKRYTRSRINRILIMILNNITKEDVSNLKNNEYVRVLGFNDKGRQYLRDLKDVNIITQFKNIPSSFKDMEWKMSNVYASFLPKDNDYIKKELKGPLIKKNTR